MNLAKIAVSAAVIVCTACPIDGGSPGSSTDKQNPGSTVTGSTNPDPSTGGANSSVWTSYDTAVCGKAIDFLTNTCGIPAAAIYYNGICDWYSACQANCIFGAGCGAWGATPDAASSDLLNQCELICYTEGPGNCREAEQHVRMCGVDVQSSWNTDLYCNASEHCLSNCVLGTQCMGLWGLGDEATSLATCQQQCLADAVVSGPLTRSASYCATFPTDTVCANGQAASIPYYCWQYPKAADCAAPVAYCAAHASDPWCTSPQYVCLINASGAGCATELPYCADHLSDPLCSPVYPPGESYCATEFSASPYCLRGATTCATSPQTPGCGLRWPAYCAKFPADPFCFDAGFYGHYCDTHLDSPECNDSTSFCSTFPQSPGCDANYVPYCDKYPNDPTCKEPDYTGRYCDWYPTSPECSTTYTPYCVKYPDDPACN